jgi:hypothetical protein
MKNSIERKVLLQATARLAMYISDSAVAAKKFYRFDYAMHGTRRMLSKRIRHLFVLGPVFNRSPIEKIQIAIT